MLAVSYLAKVEDWVRFPVSAPEDLLARQV